MDYETSYKELIEKIKSEHEKADGITRESFEHILPELRESEDERMRKIVWDILLVDSDEIREILDANNVLIQDVYAWLEKQGEEKAQAKSLWHEYNHPIDKDRLFLLISKNKRTSIMLWNGESLKSVTFGGGGGIILEGDKFAYIDELQEVQNPAEWSEEDEANASYICAALDCYLRLREERNNTNGQEDLDKARNWLYNKLKSLNELIEDYEQHVADVKAFISNVKKINNKKKKLYGKN